MANLKNIAMAFLDGFAPLDNLFRRPVRPGSRANLISDKECLIPASQANPVSRMGRKKRLDQEIEQILSGTKGPAEAAELRRASLRKLEELVAAYQNRA